MTEPPTSRPSLPAIPPDLDAEFDRLGKAIVPVVMQEDWLRILLQGHAKIQGLLDEALTDEFHGEMPKEIKTLPFPRRIAVAHGLRIIRDDKSQSAHGGERQARHRSPDF